MFPIRLPRQDSPVDPRPRDALGEGRPWLLVVGVKPDDLLVESVTPGAGELVRFGTSKSSDESAESSLESNSIISGSMETG